MTGTELIFIVTIFAFVVSLHRAEFYKSEVKRLEEFLKYYRKEDYERYKQGKGPEQ